MQPVIFFISVCGFVLFFSLSGISQAPVKDYKKEWEKVDELITKKNLPKSALAEVKKIYALAKQDKQDAQVIKSVVYMIGLQQETREENEITGIKEIEKEIAVSKEPVVSVFYSLLADVYWNYFQQNRWSFYDRSETIRFNKNDISTWSAGDFHRKISELYLFSIRNEKLLQQQSLKPYDAIIDKGNVRHLRPTLYDLLAHRALAYFKSSEYDLDKPAYAFELSQAEAFDPAMDFINKKFITKDTVSLQHKALLIYQKLISFHLPDTRPDATIDADIERLLFVYDHSTHPDKEDLYRSALKKITEQYADLPAASQAWYLLAQAYNEDADNYEPFGDTSNRYARLKAIEICERVLSQRDSSEGKVNCQNLLNSIKKTDFSFTVEKVNSPGKPFRVFLHYKNLDKLFLRLIKSNASIKEKLDNYHDEKTWEELIAAPSEKSWEQGIPSTWDYQFHGVEMKVDALPAGEYILLAASDNFSKNAVIGARLFYVSEISFINQERDYFLLHRETGKPLVNASVQTWTHQYDSKLRRYTPQKSAVYRSDSNGYFRMTEFPERNYSSNYKLEITHGTDKLFMDDWKYDYYFRNTSAEEEKTTYNIFYFTDRSIYRPGQTVFFKGIVVKKDPGNKNSAAEGYSTKIFLEDVNGEDIDSLEVKTNQYGSFSGTFRLPSSGLNGQFSIYDDESLGRASFSVEEYKRPKFFVEFEKIKETYKAGDSISITGFAKAYAGNNISGAAVKYRVVREPRFIYPWLFSRWWQPPSQSMEISHGESITDADGKFHIRFAAIPDKTIDKKLEPVFDYKIYADVTDINGETRSGESLVTAGYKSLLLITELPASMPADSFRTIVIRTENMAGEFYRSLVTLGISKLKEEKRLIRNRYWKRPDQFVMSKETYLQSFPNDEYDNESDQRSWEKTETVLQKTDSTRLNLPYSLDNKVFTPGWYKVEISTTDKNGEEIKDTRFIELTDEKSKHLLIPRYLWTQGSRSIEPGGKTQVIIGSSADDIYLIRQVIKKENIFNYSILNKGKTYFEFTATEDDRGGYGVNFFFVKNNRFYQFSDIIKIPWSNKDLKIEYATYRDKTLPGSEEKWKIKITGNKNESVAAEMLASMYDASLDQFKMHGWSKPLIWQSFINRNAWNDGMNFTTIISIQNPYYSKSKYHNLFKIYDQLLFEHILNSSNFSNSGFVKRELSMPAQHSLKLEDVQEVVVTAGIGKFTGVSVVKDEEVKGETNFKFDILPQQDKSVQIRRNFNETAFFFPDLRTDSTGVIEFSFTMPEALTKWKFQALAHTKDLSFGYSTKEIITQKQLMVQPNMPRFLREGDKLELSAKIVNLADKEITGQAELQLFDAATNESVSGWMQNMFPNQYFTVAAGQSEVMKFPVEIPFQFAKSLTWRIVAKASPLGGGLEGAFSDGEEASLPVLTNRMLVTESLPINFHGTGSKDFRFEKLLNNNSPTLQHHTVTVEYTSNPAWYAVQALPYLMEFPYECSEQTWNRFYANALASHVANSSPRIRQLFDKWKTSEPDALLSNLQKNEELKSALLAETPWVLDAKTEEQQKRNIALLFDLVRMQDELKNSFEKLKQAQAENGAFPWFKGGPDNPYITQYIITGIGHLKKTGVDITMALSLVDKALPYLDERLSKLYADLKKSKTDLSKYSPGHDVIQYLYMRSFFPEKKIPATGATAYAYFTNRAQLTWVKKSKYMQGMIALALSRGGDKKTPAAIIKSLKETSINHDELGMYWKENSGGMYWHQAPVEIQALLIEAFHEISNDAHTVNNMINWLLKNKQTNNWKTTKATAEACYALLLNGTDLLSYQPEVNIKLGNTVFNSTEGVQSESGTGYFKKTISGPMIKQEMGNINVTINSSGQNKQAITSYGAVYWQYFEDLDKITHASTPLKLDKKLFVETNTDRGPVLTPVHEGDVIKVGDKIKVRIELRVDRDMEYVHMKDMRASSLEPVNVLSGYKWQGSLGYYESTKDASTSFFFDFLRKGTHVFEYTLFATHTGNFSNGITSIQCMYAPEFSSHSEGIRINVE